MNGCRLSKQLLVTAIAAGRGLTMAEIARGSGVHKSVFSRVVRGLKTSRRVDAYIARRLGVRLAEFRGMVAEGSAHPRRSA